MVHDRRTAPYSNVGRLLVDTEVLGGRRSQGKGEREHIAKQSVLCIFCGVGRKGGRQLEGIPINTDRSRREGICLQYGASLTWHHWMLLPFCLLWQVPLGSGFGHWEVESHSSAPSAALGGGKNTQTNQKCRLRAKPSESTFSPGVPGSPW